MALIKLLKLEHYDTELSLPQYETKAAAGADLRVSLADKGSITIAPMQRVLIPTGLCFEIPEGYEVQIRPRSGISLKTGLMVVNSPGTIDSDYRGEVRIIMGNLSNKEEIIKHGERIAQMVVSPITQAQFQIAEELSDTERGQGGFGSTGRS